MSTSSTRRVHALSPAVRCDPRLAKRVPNEAARTRRRGARTLTVRRSVRLRIGPRSIVGRDLRAGAGSYCRGSRSRASWVGARSATSAATRFTSSQKAARSSSGSSNGSTTCRLAKRESEYRSAALRGAVTPIDGSSRSRSPGAPARQIGQRDPSSDPAQSSGSDRSGGRASRSLPAVMSGASGRLPAR